MVAQFCSLSFLTNNFFQLGYENATCVDFRMDRWYPAANMTIQHLMRVYDYFEPGKYNKLSNQRFPGLN